MTAHSNPGLHGESYQHPRTRPCTNPRPLPRRCCSVSQHVSVPSSTSFHSSQGASLIVALFSRLVRRGRPYISATLHAIYPRGMPTDRHSSDTVRKSVTQCSAQPAVHLHAHRRCEFATGVPKQLHFASVPIALPVTTTSQTSQPAHPQFLTAPNKMMSAIHPAVESRLLH